MMWHYFPIGFRYPVDDLTDETKRRCWQTTLAALLAADGFGATLYDTQQAYDYGSDGPVYVCIACFDNIKQSRAVAKKLYAQDALMTDLSLHHPFFQANDLESFGPYPQFGTLNADGTITPTETEFACFPQSARPANRCSGARILIAAQPTDALCAETVTRLLGKAVCAAGNRVRRVLLPDGGKGIVRALVTAKNGRFESVAYQDTAGVRQTETIGMLPGSLAVLEPSSSAALLEKAFSFGYRNFMIGEAAGDTDLQAPNDACTVEGADADAILDRIDLDALAAQADGVILVLNGEQAEPVLQRLQSPNKPVVLLTEQPFEDRERILKIFPFVREILVGSLTADALQQAFTKAAPNLITA